MALIGIVALVLLVGANVQVLRSRDAVERQLAAARAASAGAAHHLAGGDPETAGAELEQFTRTAEAARAGAHGAAWALIERIGIGRAEVHRLRQETALTAGPVPAATSLRAGLSALTRPPAGPQPGGAAMTGPEGPAGLYALDDLARGLNRYATASERADDPSATVIARAALAASILPTLAGSEGPRSWTVCRSRSGPCTRTTVSDAWSGAPRPASAPSTGSPLRRIRADELDVLVIGLDPDALFKQSAAFDPAQVFDLLLRLESGRGRNVVSMQSTLALEQQAIDQLKRR